LKTISELKCPTHYNKNIRRLRNIRNRKKKIYENAQNDNHNDITEKFNEWQFYCEEFKEAENFACQIHYENICHKIKDEHRLFWNYINNKRNHKNYPNAIASLNSDTATDHQEISNLFATFFKSVYQDPIQFDINNFSNIPNQNEVISSMQITEEEILDAIHDLD
jgi:hypothetical protein